MANEKRLIDANALWQKTFICEEVAEVRKFIENAPTVDAVEVVRCKDCKHWKDGVSGCTDYAKCCDIGYYMVGENGYCCYGERQES